MQHLKKIICILLIADMFLLPASALNVESLEADLQTAVGDSINVSFRISDSGLPANNTLVNFTTILGSLSFPFTYTNSSGIAEVSINSTVTGVSYVNASSGASYNLTNITFLPGQASSLLIDLDHSSTNAGNVTNITFSVVDQFGNINSSEDINLNIVVTDVLGSIFPDTDLSISSGNITYLDMNRTDSLVSYSSHPLDTAILRFNCTIAGNISINSTAASISNSTSIQTLSGSPGLMRIVYNDDHTVNTSSSMYVTILDNYENPVEGINVSFNVTPPENTDYNSPNDYNSASIDVDNGTTDVTGKVSNIFTADKRAGANVIGISVENTSLDHNITITGLADAIDNLLMTYTPEEALADNQETYILSARPVDQFSNPILPLTTPINEFVSFATDGGTMILIPLNTLGQANTVVGPTPYIESLSVTATYRDESGITNYTNSTTLDFVAGSLSFMDLYGIPNIVLEQNMSGNHESRITLVALDEWGHSLPDINVTFINTNTSVGTFTVDNVNGTDLINATTDSQGRIYGTFVGNVSGNTSIQATSSNISLSTNISVKDEPFLSVDLSVSPSSVNSGSVVNITTVISVEGELPLTRPAASAMLVLDRSGSMDPDYYAGTPLDVVLVLDRSGSMSGTPLTDAKEAAKEFVDNLVSNSEVGIVSFSDTSGVDIGMTSMDAYGNKAPVHNAIDSLSAGGYTAMGEGMGDANDMLIDDGRSGTTKVMIVLTDGYTNTGNDQDGEEAIEFANDNRITIYTIGLGSSLDEALLRHIASETGGSYYNAPDSSDLTEIYNTIAQELSDYDISEVEYGKEGFTPYDYSFEDSLSLPDSYNGSFTINETLNDLKVQLDWSDASDDLYLQLTSPSGEVYGLYDNTTGYYPDGNTSEYIWIQPLSYLYPDNDTDTVETGDWTFNVTGNGTGTESFTVTTYIDKKSAAKISSLAFISSFDESNGDAAGLALYSYEETVSGDNQTSYIRDNSSWVGYFTPDGSGFYNFNVTWDDTSLIDVYLYDGIDVVSSSNGTGACEVSYMLSDGGTYYLEVIKGAGSGSDTEFTINVSTSEVDTVMTAYYDSSGGGGTPKYRTWDGIEWSSESSANYVGGSPYYVRLEPSPLNSEIIMATSDSNYDVNVQIWDGSSWGNVSQFTSSLDSYSTRGFDIAYEQVSGDAVVAYMDTGIDDGVPMYRVWDGSSWSSGTTSESSNSGAGDVRWVRLETDPYSDEMVLVTLDDQRDIRAQVWDGSSWGNSTTITNDARATSYQCFDIAYEQGTGRAMVSWSDMDTGYVMYRVWDGSSWSTAANLYAPDKRVYWVKMASDPNSDDILLAALDNAYDIHVTAWNGSSWSSPQEIETNVREYSRRSVDVAFERSSGMGMVAWGTSDLTPRYRIWNGSSWSSENSASSLGGSGYTRWVQLNPDPTSDDIFLMTSDGNSDLNIQKWDGSSWDIVTEVETSSTRYYECFDMAFNEGNSTAQSTPVSWSQWTASVTSTLENDSLSHLENAIDTITADGLTAIDEGLFVANNELSSTDGNSTIVVMTDGMDNAGYHSLMEEAYKAQDNGTVIYTVGFGDNESEVDPVLEEIANITGGEYYFAPNSSVLKEIFTGIASQITNFSADGPVLDINVPYNYVSASAVAKATYISGSSNSSTGNATFFSSPLAPATGNGEPSINTSGSMTTLEWQLPNMGAGDKWGIWYQMQIDGAGYVPLIMPSSTVTYTDLSGENITIYIPSGGGANVGGGLANVLSYSLGSLGLDPDHDTMTIGSTTDIELTLTDEMGNSSYGYVYLYSNMGYFDSYENPVNVTVVGTDSVSFSSSMAGKAYITAYAYNMNNMSDVLVSSDVIYVRPKGSISIC